MVNYDEMSDLEVVTEVAKHLDLLVMSEDGPRYNYEYREKYPSTIWVAKHRHGKQTEPWEQFNCVKCPNDAWSVIVENKIDVSHTVTGDVNCAVFKPDVRGLYREFYSTTDKNPLRAAMICFLKLMDATND